MTIVRTGTSVAAIAAWLGIAGAAAAQTTIDMLHVENNPDAVALWEELAAEYEAANPGIDVNLEFLENEAFKAKLPSLLQSDEAPDIFYSWGGGVLDIQRESGALRPLTEMMDAEGGAWRNTYSEGAINGLSFDGDVWAVPYRTGVVAFFYNKEQFEQAGVEAAAIQTWDDLLAAVQTLKDAGLTPITCGGADKWPLHFYYSYLIMRNGGSAALEAAKSGAPDAYLDPAIVQAGEQVAELGALEPCQNGWQGSRWPEPLGDFADGRAAMILGFEDTNLDQISQATDGQGLAQENIGRFAFPVVEGGAGAATDTFGGLNGWAVTANAPDEAIDFLRWFTAPEQQRRQAETTGMIPVVAGAEEGVVDPLVRASAEALATSGYHQNYLDQDLGPNLGRTVNDVTVELWDGSTSPEDAAQTLQDTAMMEEM
ncbi:extracellular solute-binding protein [Rubellimicrobium roseum]|nr:extracellular solute-binding protein [Rubellimicrobium roseum]